MRIIGGNFGGRLIKSPPGHKTHPMSEKIRGAIFNALGDLSGLNLLDAFAGSGAVAIEAVSRGASKVYAVDSDKKAISTIVDNNLSLKAGLIISQANINSWLDTNQGLLFDIVIADPPYDDIKQQHLDKLATVLKDDGIIVFSLPKDYRSSDYPQLVFLSKKEYGDSKLEFYRKIS